MNSLLEQVIWGSVWLVLCAMVHVGFAAAIVGTLQKVSPRLQNRNVMTRFVSLIGLVFFGITLSHTVHIWFWAASFRWMGVFEDLTTALYFSIVTYTTLGYGDIVIGEGHRVFGAFASITGILAFGISTAFLVAVISRVLQSNQSGIPDRF